jgi:hypothetical protein
MTQLHLFKEAFTQFCTRVRLARVELSEEDIRQIFTECRVVEHLGYEGAGKDVFYEKRTGEGRTDLVAYAKSPFLPQITIEFKRNEEEPPRDFNKHTKQLIDYLLKNGAQIGILTDGIQIRIAQQIPAIGKKSKICAVSEIKNQLISDLSDVEFEWLFDNLQKDALDVSKKKSVFRHLRHQYRPTLFFRQDTTPFYYYQAFQLDSHSEFGRLVNTTIDLLNKSLELNEEGKGFAFTRGAYDFWYEANRKTIQIGDIPKTWNIFLEKPNTDINKLLFCIETAYALFSRLTLAKVAEDLDFEILSISQTIENKYTDEKSETIYPVTYPLVVRELFKVMEHRLVESIFEEDIFSWWTEGYEPLLAYTKSEFLKKLMEPRDIQGAFGHALGDLIAAVYCFDYKEISSDILGNLYQRYFDRNIRKALGEFFTPIPIANLILDLVDYIPRKTSYITSKRLIDQSCGSGTFIKLAVRRYLSEAKTESVYRQKGGWDVILSELCNGPHIVGFDIHPFSVMIAQINFMMEILPKYKEARKKNRNFVIHRIPIFRTDSLNFEEEEKLKEIEKSSTGLFNTEREFTVPITLPIYAKGSKLPLQIYIRTPFRAILRQKIIDLTEDDYFCALQAVLDAAKISANKKVYRVTEEDLTHSLELYLKRKSKSWIQQIASELCEYSDHIALEIKRLVEEYKDGRLVKTIEDMVLASYLKGTPSNRKYSIMYDFVVGNPPYVRKEIVKQFQEGYKERVLGGGKKGTFYYPVYSGDNDLYVYFIYSGSELLAENGKLGFIVSGKFIKARYGKFITAYLTTKRTMCNIIDLRGNKVFADATNDPIILSLANKIPASENEIDVIQLSSDASRVGTENEILQIVQSIKSVIGTESIANDILSYSISQKKLIDTIVFPQSDRAYSNGWNIIASRGSETIEKISSAGLALKNVADTWFSIKTGANAIMVVSENDIKQNNFEKEFLNPVIEGEDVRRWNINWRKTYLIFPYQKNEKSQYQLVDTKNYPNLYNHLLLNKGVLEKRSDIRNKKSNWHELRPCNYYDIFFKPKIVVPDIASGNNFTLDSNSFLCLHTVYLITLKNSSKETSLKYLLGLLNSKTLEFFFRNDSSNLGKDASRYQRRFLERLPIKVPSVKKEKEIASAIETTVEKILSQTYSIQHISKFPYPFILQRDPIKRYIKHTFKKSHTNINPTIELDLTGTYTVLIDSEPIEVHSEIEAEFLKRYLVERYTISSKTEIEVPIPKNAIDVIKKYDREKTELNNISVIELENEIDEMVYKLYGLNKEDQKIVADFLPK